MHSESEHSTDVAIIGAGIVGIASAYYLAKHHNITNTVLIDAGQPMAFTSAQSGENYRNWWSHPDMVALTNRSIDLMEQIARETGNRINMTRRGYALATRETDIDGLVGELHNGLGIDAESLLRFHTRSSSTSYLPPLSADWKQAPDGVDILQERSLIQHYYPSFAQDVRTVIHIRRGGDISSQQLGMFMLDQLKTQGMARLLGEVSSIEQNDGFKLDVVSASGRTAVKAQRLINAAGPFAQKIAGMLGERLPIINTFQQKIAFEDREQTVPRNMPFAIDLDNQTLDWSMEDLQVLKEDKETEWLTQPMPGAIHCRPDGGDSGRWVKLGWAYNNRAEEPTRQLPLDEHYPDIVLRGAARLNPQLKRYYGCLPRNTHHYGGWYSMTEENFPLIGPMSSKGAFMNCAHSGFGTMAACAAGELCASWVADSSEVDRASNFSLARYSNAELIRSLHAGAKGIL